MDLTLAMQANGLDHGLDQAISQSIDPMNAVDYTVGISFEMSIGDRGPKAALDRHENQRRQAITNLVSVAKQVVLNVKQELREVYSSYEEIAYRDRVREAASREFQGILDLENIRPRTPEFLQLKLDSQARLAQAEQQLTQTIVNYNLAVMRLEQAKGTLLEFDRISLDKAPKAPEMPHGHSAGTGRHRPFQAARPLNGRSPVVRSQDLGNLAWPNALSPSPAHTTPPTNFQPGSSSFATHRMDRASSYSTTASTGITPRDISNTAKPPGRRRSASCARRRASGRWTGWAAFNATCIMRFIRQKRDTSPRP